MFKNVVYTIVQMINSKLIYGPSVRMSTITLDWNQAAGLKKANFYEEDLNKRRP